jgi:hypothetical protein
MKRGEVSHELTSRYVSYDLSTTSVSYTAEQLQNAINDAFGEDQHRTLALVAHLGQIMGNEGSD